MVKLLETQLVLPLPKALVFAYPALDFNFTSWMTPDNLRILQSEQSSGHIPSLAAQKDHLRHISPLSMVSDRKGVQVRRRRSWRDALRKLASPIDERSKLTLRHSTTSSRALLGQGGADGPNGDAEAGEMADVEEGVTREEDKPLQARVRFHPEVEERILARQQREADAMIPGQGASADQAPLGTRLTMTSRTGYFSDRIISPSMVRTFPPRCYVVAFCVEADLVLTSLPPSQMRAMAILYIGPHRNPDFATDYHLSPLKAPSHLLTQFPPILMACGEKDPFVDDTLIFAGRVREAKRMRRADLDAVLSGRTSRTLESFLLAKDDLSQEEAVRALRRERDLLVVQGDEDWVTMQIYSEWSHGFLQMPMLLQEARAVIDSMADWMDEAFAAAGTKAGPAARRGSVSTRLGSKRGSPPRRSVPALGDRSASMTSETETETDDALTIVSKKRSPPPATVFGTESGATDLATERHVRGQSGSHDRVNGVEAVPTGGSIAGIPRFDLLHDLPTAPVSQSGSRRGSSPSKPPTPTKAGQIISETELMRRRRLLDSHLISTDSVK